jgi:hypothetical protein
MTVICVLSISVDNRRNIKGFLSPQNLEILIASHFYGSNINILAFGDMSFIKR